VTQHAFGERERLIVAATDGVAGAPPQLSVIVCADPDSTGLAACLASLADQSLDASRFETVLVWRGSLASEAEPEPAPAAGVRLLTASGASLSEARTIGLEAARGTHCLFVDPDDVVAPGLLEWLLDRSEPGVVPTAHFPGGDGTFVGSQGDARTAWLLSRATGKLVESEVARRVRFDERLDAGADAAYWWNLWTQEGLELREAGEGDGADYTPASPGPASSPESVIEGSLGIIEDLRGLSPTGPRARKMRDLMVDQAAEGIRLLLLEHPDLHETVVEEVRRRRIPRMPWPVVNRGRATQLAVLFGYPPFLDPSSIVAAKRLTQLGRITDVVSQDISTLRKQDPGATRIASEYVDRSVMLPGVRRFDDWGSVRGYVEDALAQISELEADAGPYESMYSRALAAHSHFAAALVKLRSPELHWVAEFSDPLLRNAHGGWREEQMEDDWLRRRLAGALKASGYDVPASNRIFEWAELIVYAWADEIIFTNQNQLDFMLGYCAHPALAQRAATVSRATHHPVPPAHLYEASRARYALPPSKVHIGYFGNFYVNRGLEDLTAALRGLSPADRARVQLHIFTDEPEPLVLETIEHGLSDVIAVNPLLGYVQYLNILTRIDVLLITDFSTPHYDPNPYLPSKLSDYRGSGSPIWSLYEPGSVLSTEKTDYATRLGDAAGVAGVLRDLLTKAGQRGRWRQVFGDAAELHSS